MRKNTREQCQGCVYVQQPFCCDSCMRWYGNFPDRFLDESNFYDVGGDFPAQAGHWPDNLYCAVMSITPRQYSRRPRNLEENVHKAIYFLPERDRTVLLMRYKEKRSLKETKSVLGVSTERVRQLQMQAVRKLRVPALSQLLTFGCGINELSSKAGQTEEGGSSNGTFELLSSGYSIRELSINFRTFSALARAGLFTIPDISGMTDADLRKIPGIGKQGVLELRQALTRYFEETGRDQAFPASSE